MKLNAYAKLILKHSKNVSVAFEITCTNYWNVYLMLYILPGAKQKRQKGEPVDKSLNILSFKLTSDSAVLLCLVI